MEQHIIQGWFFFPLSNFKLLFQCLLHQFYQWEVCYQSNIFIFVKQSSENVYIFFPLLCCSKFPYLMILCGFVFLNSLWYQIEFLIKDAGLLLNWKLFQLSTCRLLLLLRVYWSLYVYLLKCLLVFLDFSFNPFLMNFLVLSYYSVILWGAQLYLAFHSYIQFDCLHFCYIIYANGWERFIYSLIQTFMYLRMLSAWIHWVPIGIVLCVREDYSIFLWNKWTSFSFSFFFFLYLNIFIILVRVKENMVN